MDYLFFVKFIKSVMKCQIFYFKFNIVMAWFQRIVLISVAILGIICFTEIIQRALVRILNQLKSGSHLAKSLISFTSMKAFKNNEKCFLFHINKNSFHS